MQIFIKPRHRKNIISDRLILSNRSLESRVLPISVILSGQHSLAGWKMARYHDIQGRPSITIRLSKKKYVLGYLYYSKVEEYDDRRWSNHLMRVPAVAFQLIKKKKEKKIGKRGVTVGGASGLVVNLISWQLEARHDGSNNFRKCNKMLPSRSTLLRAPRLPIFDFRHSFPYSRAFVRLFHHDTAPVLVTGN